MKTLITTAAILAATASIASANPANNSDPLEEQLAAAEAALVQSETALADTQNELALYKTEYAAVSSQVGGLQDSLTAANAKYNNITQSIDLADDKKYRVMGDLFTTIYEGTSYYESKNASYDPGSSAVTFNTNFSNGSVTLSNVTLSGMYHTFSIDTDIGLSSGTEKGKLQALVHVINDKAYNEGYKDGFNDGFEIGFDKGYKTAVYDIRSAESQL